MENDEVRRKSSEESWFDYGSRTGESDGRTLDWKPLPPISSLFQEVHRAQYMDYLAAYGEGWFIGLVDSGLEDATNGRR